MTITLRNLPKDVEAAILETSKREGISRNKATLRLLEAAVHKPDKKPRLNHDFDKYFGTWSAAEADAFDAALAEMRRVDPADWEAPGVNIPRNDVWIAASAIEHGLHLVTLDAHFREIPLLLIQP